MNLQFLLLASILNGVWSFSSISSPVCVIKCWDSSIFVSTCSSETKCLCKDAFFQSAVLQCLYTQCQTSQFGSAVHHALLKCSTYETDDFENSPPLIRRQGLRKQGSGTVRNISSHASASVIRTTVRRSAASSAFYSPYPSGSVAPIMVSDQEEQSTSARSRLSPTRSATLNSTAILNTLSTGI